MNNYDKIDVIQEQKKFELKEGKINEKLLKCEEDKIEGLKLFKYEQFLYNIFPHHFNKSYKGEIIDELKQYKNIQIGAIKFFSKEYKNYDDGLLYSFNIIIKKISDNEVNIHYKLGYYKIEIESDIDHKSSNNNNRNFKLKDSKKTDKNKCCCC